MIGFYRVRKKRTRRCERDVGKKEAQREKGKPKK